MGNLVDNLRKMVVQGELHNYGRSMAVQPGVKTNCTFYGLAVIENPTCFMREPVRKHVQSKSGSAVYHARIQKKWIKRWGEHCVPSAYVVGGAIVMHPTLLKQLIAECGL